MKANHRRKLRGLLAVIVLFGLLAASSTPLLPALAQGPGVKIITSGGKTFVRVIPAEIPNLLDALRDIGSGDAAEAEAPILKVGGRTINLHDAILDLGGSPEQPFDIQLDGAGSTALQVEIAVGDQTLFSESLAPRDEGSGAGDAASHGTGLEDVLNAGGVGNNPLTGLSDGAGGGDDSARTEGTGTGDQLGSGPEAEQGAGSGDQARSGQVGETEVGEPPAQKPELAAGFADKAKAIRDALLFRMQMDMDIDPSKLPGWNELPPDKQNQLRQVAEVCNSVVRRSRENARSARP